jgi:hypothetical protein
MLNLTDLASVPSDPPAPFTGRLRLAVAAYLARFTGISRNRTGSGPATQNSGYCREVSVGDAGAGFPGQRS